MLEHFNVYDDHVMEIDHKRHMFADVYFRNDRVYCELCREETCEHADAYIRTQILWKWQTTELVELSVPDRYVDIFQGRALYSVLGKHSLAKILKDGKRFSTKPNWQSLTGHVMLPRQRIYIKEVDYK